MVAADGKFEPWDHLKESKAALSMFEDGDQKDQGLGLAALIHGILAVEERLGQIAEITHPGRQG